MRDLLIRHLAARTLDTDALLAALQSLDGPTEKPSLLELAERVAAEGRPELGSLNVQLDRRLVRLAVRARALLTSERPWTPAMELELGALRMDHTPDSGLIARLAVIEQLARQRHALPSAGDRAAKYEPALERARGQALPWDLVGFDVPELERDAADDFVAQTDDARRRELLVAVMSLPDDRVAHALTSLRPSEFLRVALALSLRSGVEGGSSHTLVREWGDAHTRRVARADTEGRRIADAYPLALRAVYADLDPNATVASRESADRALTEARGAAPLEVPPERAHETSRPVLPPEPAPPPTPQVARPSPAPPPKPVKPTVWDAHIQPFLVENWHFATGALMVVAGASLFAYFTWDRHWLVRYTVLPLLLGTFTATLAGLGGWLERKDETLRGTAAVLRGAAIGLLPINFMTVALLAADSSLGQPMLVVPLIAALYVGAAGWGLRRWCEGVLPGLGTLLGGTLLALCCLVVLRPIALTLAVGDQPLRIILGAGFYIGFVVVALAVFRFTSTLLTPAVARDKRVPWFFGATLILTLLQVFVWVHASMGHLPRVYTYAPMLIAAGALVLHVERRALHMVGADGRLEAESFLGFALILLGLLMAQMNPWVRVIGFALAGAVWLWQAPPRRHPLHAWIGLSLLAMAGASVGLLPGFPEAARPWLGIALSLAAGLGARAFDGRAKGLLAGTARELQVVLLVLTVPVAVLGQWRANSDPFATAAALLVVSAMLAVRAHREGRQRWLLTSAVVVAMALPYLGCVDLAGRSLHGNTMVFGLAVLSLLWIALDRIAPSVLTRRSRSTVLWFYGALAVVGMVLRVVIEQRTPGDLLWYRAFMDHAGPVMAAFALGFAAYWSRSLVPGAMAAVILILLFPELRSQYHDTFDRIGWGTGFGSALSGVLLVSVCFFLRASDRFRALGPGDRFPGEAQFPLQRRDWTLFTWPLVASAMFLFGKTLTVTLAANFNANMVWQAAAAQCIAAGGWLLLANYGRTYAGAKHAVRLGFAQLFLGIGTWNLIVIDSRSPSQALLIYLVAVQALYVLIRFGTARRWPWQGALLAKPARALLRNLSLLLAPLLVIGLVGLDESLPRYLLALFVAGQLAWHGIAERKSRFGVLLVPLVWIGVLRFSLPEARFGSVNTAVHHIAAVTSAFVLSLQALLALADRRTSWYALVRPLARPAQSWTALLVGGTAAIVVIWTTHVDSFPVVTLALTAGAALAIARANRSGMFAVLGLLVLYALVCVPALRGLDGGVARVAELVTPWRWSLFALLLGGLAASGSFLVARAPGLLTGAHPVLFDRASPRLWLEATAASVAASATFLQVFRPEWQQDIAQLPAPYIAAATFALLASSSRRPWTLFGSAALVAIGNIQSVDVLAGPWLRDLGISQIQVVCLGLSVTVVVAILLHRFTQKRSLVPVADRTAACGAGLVLLLLAAQYLAEPDVAGMTTERLLVSGALAFAAAQAFRELARRPRGERPFPVVAAEPAYHLGLTVTLWCLALLVPPLRQPAATLVALSLPFFFLLYRTESEFRADSVTASRYRRSAMVLGFLLVGLIVLRSVFQVVLFPGTPVLTDHYHHNSLLLMLIGLGLVRLHALGGSYWVAFYGGLALIVGSYFGVTAFPGLSPFTHVVAGCWSMIVVGHFWTLASAERSPLRAGMQTLGGIDDDVWHQIRTGWGYVVLAATQLPLLLAVRAGADTMMLAPLLAGSATIVIHHGLRRRSRVYLLVAGAELLLALHFDFLVPSLIPKPWVVWILLASWGALLAARRMPRTAAYAVAALAFLHVLHLDPASPAGLGAFATISALLLFTPQRATSWNASEDGWTALLLVAPTWLAYFAALRAGYDYLDAWPVVLAAGMLLLTGGFADWCRRQAPVAQKTNRPILLDRLVSLLQQDGERVRTVAVYAGFAVAATTFLLHYDAPYDTKTIYVLCAAFAASSVGFRLEGSERHSMLPYFLMQLSGLAFFAAIRRQLMLTTNFWTHEYDVWAACATTVFFAGAKEVFDLRPREVRVPVTTALFALPVVALIWTIVHGLGTNVALLVVGLNSTVFAFLGKDDRESPYNLVAVGGFVGFVILTFWSKLELRSVQAYVVPVAVGVLVLVQMFRARLPSPLVARIRVLAGFAIVGSAAGEALLDQRYPIGFHVSLLLLSLLVMGVGSVLRVRVYLVAGAAGILTALASITYRGLAGLERAAQMSAIGLLVLVIGAALVAGATYYKTHRDSAHATFDRWRRRFGEWE